MRQSYPYCPSSAHLYHQHGLVDSRTIYPYFSRLGPTEVDLIKTSKAGIALCPDFEVAVNWDEIVHGVFDPAELKVRWSVNDTKSHVQIGLGTCCTVATSPSVLSVARKVLDMRLAAGSVFMEKSHNERLAEVFYMATLGGAALCGLDHRVGSFEPGKELDALRIAPRSPHIPCFQKEIATWRFQRWVQCGDDRDINHVYVRGVRVAGAGPHHLG